MTWISCEVAGFLAKKVGPFRGLSFVGTLDTGLDTSTSLAGRTANGWDGCVQGTQIGTLGIPPVHNRSTGAPSHPLTTSNGRHTAATTTTATPSGPATLK